MIDLLTNNNYIIAMGYYLLALLVVLAPVSFVWLRDFGWWGAVWALCMVLFFVGCGTHHLEWAAHIEDATFCYGSEYICLKAESVEHFLIADTVQPIGAIGAALIGVFKWRFFCEKLMSRRDRERQRMEEERSNDAGDR